MCGRYTLTRPDPKSPFSVTQLFNVAPGQSMPIVLESGAIEATWGLLPGWAKEGMKPQINARADTAATKPFFRHAFKSSRCLVPADGWFEWQQTASGKVPNYIHRPSGENFYMAGLREEKDGKSTYAILTTTAHSTIQWLHSRMPVILPESALETWLEPKSERDALEALLLPTDNWEAYPVSRLVNSPKNDSADCIKPV